jgi:hypothetical protein
MRWTARRRWVMVGKRSRIPHGLNQGVPMNKVTWFLRLLGLAFNTLLLLREGRDHGWI